MSKNTSLLRIFDFLKFIQNYLVTQNRAELVPILPKKHFPQITRNLIIHQLIFENPELTTIVDKFGEFISYSVSSGFSKIRLSTTADKFGDFTSCSVYPTNTRTH